MKRLSRRAWNNVLIVSMLVMILVLNWDQFGVSNSEHSGIFAVPQDMQISSMSINGVELEQAGTQWRVSSSGLTPAVMPSPEHLNTMISAWQTAYFELVEFDYPKDRFWAPEVVVNINLVGANDTKRVAFTVIDNTFVTIIDGKLYHLYSPSIEALLEPIINVKK